MEEKLSDEDKSDSEILNECERELQELENGKNGKRTRESEDGSEDGFITVQRKGSKRLIRSCSTENMSYMDSNIVVHRNINNTYILEKEKYEVCLFSQQIMPKQMAFARFLRNEGIINVSKIKYKSPYKIFIVFNSKEQAEKLITNRKLAEMNIRAQFTDESNLSYGIIRGVDLDISEKELLENLRASCEIVSAKRMKRLDGENKWVECESVRLCFKNVSIPSVIDAYGCKYDVDKYVFPVTQCSGCWKFGHSKKFCSLNKMICPKCGKDHTNCDTEEYKCPNCKGSHIALDKMCPFFLKEKKIRYIMSEENITYKKALELYLRNEKENKKKEETEVITISSSKNPNENTVRTYSSVVKTTAEVNIQGKENNLNSDTAKKSNSTKKKRKKVIKDKIPNTQEETSMDYEISSSENEDSIDKVTKKDEDKEKRRKFNICDLIWKLKEIFMSEDKFEDKIRMVLKTIVETFKLIFMTSFSSGIWAEKFLNLWNG